MLRKRKAFKGLLLLYSSEIIMAKYLVLGDVHGCREYLDTMLAVGAFENIDGVLATGDIGGYGPDSLYCYQFLMDLKKRFEAEGKVFKAVRGNHEEALEKQIMNPDVDVDGIRKTAKAGILQALEQMLGKDVCKEEEDEKVLDSRVVRSILFDDWYERLNGGNVDIVNPNYIQDIQERVTQKVTEKVVPQAAGWKRKNVIGSAVRSVIEQTFNFLPEYASMCEQIELLRKLPEVLSFIVNLPREDKVGNVKMMHTVQVDGKKDPYVMGEEQLAYMNKVRGFLGKQKMDKNNYLTDSEVFASGVFDDCNVLILGHMHSSDIYRNEGKTILMANSPFPRDGLGVRAPILIYDGGLITRKDHKYNFAETERKLRTANPRFLEQIELYRKVTRK